MRIKGLAVMVAVALAGANSMAMQAGTGPSLRVADGEGCSFSVQAGVMMQSGEARELVYYGDHKLSELIWDISGLALAGGSVSAILGDAWQLNAGIWFAVNKGDGSMEDYDWMIPGLDWTHFSDGDVEINSAYVFDVNGMYTFNRGKPIEVFGMLGYKRMFWDWSEYGRTYIYSVYGWRDDRGSSGGVNGIDYEQLFDVPYVGLGARFGSGRLDGSLYVTYSPLVQAEDKDHHILRSLVFEETFEGIEYIGFGGAATLRFGQSAFVNVAVDGHTVPEARGDTEILDEETGERFYTTDSAGIENVVVSVTAAIGLLL